MGVTQKLLGAPTISGWSGVEYAPKPPGMYKNDKKNGRFPTLIDLKIAKNAVFTQK